MGWCGATIRSIENIKFGRDEKYTLQWDDGVENTEDSEDTIKFRSADEIRFVEHTPKSGGGVLLMTSDPPTECIAPCYCSSCVKPKQKPSNMFSRQASSSDQSDVLEQPDTGSDVATKDEGAKSKYYFDEESITVSRRRLAHHPLFLHLIDEMTEAGIEL